MTSFLLNTGADFMVVKNCYKVSYGAFIQMESQQINKRNK